jgi:hypothetical protein
MAWVRVTDAVPAENEQILIYDNENNKIESGRYVAGRWYIENLQNGQLHEVSEVTHWAPVLDSEINDTSDDD